MHEHRNGMLALTRKPSQRILVGADIWIEILEIQSGGRVRLGIDAPRDMPIHREENLAIPGVQAIIAAWENEIDRLRAEVAELRQKLVSVEQADPLHREWQDEGVPG
jgi:carbon storage regulator